MEFNALIDKKLVKFSASNEKIASLFERIATELCAIGQESLIKLAFSPQIARHALFGDRPRHTL